MEYLMLPEKDNFIRLRDCDFNKLTDYKDMIDERELKKSRIPGTLTGFSNPILILFYYNNSRENILTEFFESSNGEDFEPGDKADSIFEKEEDNEELEFKFGYVNLDMEKEVLETFREMTGLNPFSWCKIESDSSNPPRYGEYPFIIFYYNTLPQFMYEGVIDSETIKLEFRNWRKELIELENKDIEDLKKIDLSKEGYFTALADNKPIKGLVKGKSYWIEVTEDSTGLFNYLIRPV